MAGVIRGPIRSMVVINSLNDLPEWLEALSYRLSSPGQLGVQAAREGPPPVYRGGSNST